MRLTDALRISATSEKPVIALIGAGGKSSLLFRLGDELAADGKHTLLTATTRLWARQIDQAPFSLIGDDPALLAQELPTSLRGYHQVLVLTGPAAEADKLRGLPPEVICRLSALGDVEATVVEADGSRERPLKAPAHHEPVVPPCATHIVTVAGMRALGRPLDAATVHRPETAANLAGLHVGDPLTPEAIAAVLAHPQGGLKGHRPEGFSFLYLNLAGDASGAQAESNERLATARQVARIVLGSPMSLPAYQAVMIGNAQAVEPVDEVHGCVAGVVLAAGCSSRVGGDLPKQLLPWDPGGTLVGHAVDRALASRLISTVSVVSGYCGEQVAAALQDRRVAVVNNPNWASGQSSSVRGAIQALSPDISAVLFLLADQPAVESETIDLLVLAYRRTGAPIVAPVYRNGQRGNPVLFDRCVFPELLALEGDTGGRPVIERYGPAVHLVAIDLPQPRGIETQEEYWRQQSLAHARKAGLTAAIE